MDQEDSESTVTSIEENTENFCDNPTRDILADGIISLFKSTADQLQDRVRTTRFVVDISISVMYDDNFPALLKTT